MLFTIIVINFFDGYFYNNVIILHTSCPFFFLHPIRNDAKPSFFSTEKCLSWQNGKKVHGWSEEKEKKKPPLTTRHYWLETSPHDVLGAWRKLELENWRKLELDPHEYSKNVQNATYRVSQIQDCTKNPGAFEGAKLPSAPPCQPTKYQLC